MQGAMCRVCSAPRWSRRCASYTPLTPGAIPPGRSPRFLPYPGPSLGRRVASFPPRHPTLQDQSYPCLLLRESRSSPSVIRRLFLSITCTKMLLGGFWRGKFKSTLFALRSQKRSLASREQPQGFSPGIQQERSAPPPPLEARGLETRVPTARLRRPPLAGGARPGTSSQHPGAGTPPASVAAACALAGSIRSHFAGKSPLVLLKRSY